MNSYLILIMGVIIGGVAVYFLMRSGKTVAGDIQSESLIEKQAREKIANKEAVLDLLETQGKLTNNHIEMMLGISDATAERYLQELEKEGKVKQIGNTGSGVYYTSTNSVQAKKI